MISPDPTHYGWWIASRAAGVVALIAVSLSVILGLTMSTRLLGRFPRLKRLLLGSHEHLALAGMIAIAVHGLTLLGDHWIKATPTDLIVPFTMHYRPFWTGLGVIGGLLTIVLGLSFYARRRIGARRWRSLHRFTVLAYLLGIVHAIGAGTDAPTPWLRAIILGSIVPVTFLAVLRFAQSRTTAPAARRSSPA